MRPPMFMPMSRSGVKGGREHCSEDDDCEKKGIAQAKQMLTERETR